MKHRIYLLVLLAMSAGCATHRDLLSTFRLSGVVQFRGSEQEEASNRAQIALIDSGLDDIRSHSEHKFALFEVEGGKQFQLVRPYSWGTTRSHPYERATITVSVTAHGCEPVHREVLIGALPREDREMLLDVGAIELVCSAGEGRKKQEK